MSLQQTILQTAPVHVMQARGFAGAFIFGAVGAVSVLLVAIGIFYVLIKLGSLIDAMKQKTEAAVIKK